MRASTASRISSAVVTLTTSQCDGGCKRRRPADENHLCAAALRGLGQRVAHLAAGAVAEKAHRVQRLARASGGHQHNLAGQIVAAAQRAEHRVGNRLRLSHAPRAHHAAGQLARARLDHAHAALAQDFKIGLGRRMLPHIHVHRRSHQHRRSGRQIHRGQKIVGDAVGKLGQNVGRGRRDHQRIGPLRLADVLDARIRTRRRRCRPSSHRLVMTLWPVSAAKVSGCTNLRGRLGHHHVDFEGLALQRAHQFRRLVRGNSARDADRYSHGSIVEQWSVDE